MGIGANSLMLLSVLMVASAGCVGTPGGPHCDVEQDTQGQKVICNGAVFSYTLQGARSLQTDQYSWQNEGDRAHVSAVFQGNSGTIYVTIKDHNGVQVYSRQHAGTGQSVASQPTEDGTPGTWTVKIETRGLNGQVVLEVHRGG